ncbi:hypothetical protein [Aestuariivita boseongensis]|uniref:hypothetical protein n=1 Tax=Aestuariivita boseongensis TaxID=1470562 RepID=UPI0006816C6A|nr:hypothetical protein [Aestuariivita boseongensis]
MFGWLSPEWPEIDARTAILWEPCSKSHGEIVPGYAQLLLDLKYRVVVLMTPQRLDEGLFSRMSHPRLELPRLTQRQIGRFAKTGAMNKAAVVLISTAGKLPHTDQGNADLQRVFGAEVPPGLLLVEHDAQLRIDAGTWSDRAITLRGLDYKGAQSTIINPHRFGEVRITPKSDGKTIFLLVGAARAKRRNQNLVFDAAERLLGEGHTNFEIRLIGKKGGQTIPPRLEQHVTELGRVDFSDLYKQVEDADFIVTAFQADNPDHLAYRTVKTTGSFQLCYGFGTPCIVQEQFANGTALTAENSLFYDTDAQMFDAMRAAILMKADTYARMQSQLVHDAGALYQTSLENLKALIHG